MFLPLASCMFFLPVISFVHRCLPLAVPVCPQRSMSVPSICRDFLFPNGYIPAQLNSPCASVSGNPASREGDRLLVPSQGRSAGVTAPSLLACCILLCLGEGREFGQRLYEGVEDPLTPCSPFSVPGFCSRAGRFLASSSSEGHQLLVSFPARGVNQETSWPCCEMPLPDVVRSEGVVLEQPVAAWEEWLRRRQEQSQNSSEMGREMRWLTFEAR